VLKHLSNLSKNRKSSSPRQGGQAVVIVALALIALVGVSGLALDAGRAYVDHRALQGGADSAALSATQLIAYNLRVPLSKTDLDVKNSVIATVNQSRASGSDVTAFPPASFAPCDTTATTAPTNKLATCAWYADFYGNLLLSPGTSGNLTNGHAVQVGNGVIPPSCPSSSAVFWGSYCTAGITLVPYYAHKTLFLSALGITDAIERASATAIFTPVVTTPDTGYAHYAIADCISNSRAPQVGDQVTLRSNSWRSTYNNQCSLQGDAGSNNFKGWFHDPKVTTPSTSIPSPAPAGGCSAAIGPNYCGLPNPAPSLTAGGAKTTFTELDYFSSAGGNAIGLEAADIAIIHSSYVSCHGSPPCHYILLPVVDYVNGNGSSIDMHIINWVAALPDQDWNSPAQGDWTATVVGKVTRRADWTGCPAATTCPPITPSTPLSLQLFR